MENHDKITGVSLFGVFCCDTRKILSCVASACMRKQASQGCWHLLQEPNSDARLVK